MKAYFQKRILQFIKPATTSRGIMLNKPVWYLYFYDELEPSVKGIGECSIIPGLSVDDENKVEEKLSEICNQINTGGFDFNKTLNDFPGVNFAVETALADFKANGTKNLFPSNFTKGAEGIKINGLIWMGTRESMNDQINEKIEKGFRCIKLKMGSHNTSDELLILRNIRKNFSAKDLELRVDANGAFNKKNVIEILKQLAELEIHSIEQPILPSQLYEMARLCALSPVPIALDEELLGKYPVENKRKLIDMIRPQFLVLKPGLLGGFKETMDWINIANEMKSDWWITSALESNIGLNAISQWTYSLDVTMHQGLGTGQLYVKNIESPLEVSGEKIFYNSDKKWNFDFLN